MKSTYFSRLIATALVCTLAAGCSTTKVRIQSSENLYIAERQTKLVAGLRRAEDIRPESEKASDGNNDRPRDTVVSELIYKNFKLSGLFQNVLFDRFNEDQVDVILTPRLKSFTSLDVPNEKTAMAMGIAFIPVINLIYGAAGGPISDQKAIIDIDLEFKKGAVVKNIVASKSLAFTKRLNENPASKIGQLEGDVLADAVRELITKTASSLD